MIDIKETDKWFSDSPDVGTPECICSRCGNVITEQECPIRMFDEDENKELRFCEKCM